MSFWSRVKARKNSRRDDCADLNRSLRQSQSCDGLVGSASGKPTDAKVSLADFLADSVIDDGGGGAGIRPSEDAEILTSWSSLVKQRSRLSKSVKVNIF
jgi:hypothetical protein